MNKNAIIGLLVVVLLIGLGLYISKNNTTPSVDVAVNTTPTTESTPTSTTTQKPDAPVVQTSTGNTTSSSTAAITGKVKPNGASTTYWFEYGNSTALGNLSTSQAIGSGYSLIPTPGFITGLKANSLYYYRLSAKNSFGTVNGDTYTLETNNSPAPTGKAPTVRTNQASTITDNSAIINGQVNPNGSSAQYWFEYGTDTNFGNVTQLLETNSGTTFVIAKDFISYLQPDTKYYFRLNAQNQYGTVNGPTANFTTSASPATSSQPTAETVSANSITSTSATLNGHVNPNGADTTYWFEYSSDSLLGNLLGSASKNQISGGSNNTNVHIDVNGLNPDTQYYYRIVATNSSGTVYGSKLSFTTKK